MKRKTIIAWLGFFVIIVPFLGVPIQWKEYALISLGVFIVLVALSGGRRKAVQGNRDSAYVENNQAGVDKSQNPV